MRSTGPTNLRGAGVWDRWTNSTPHSARQEIASKHVSGRRILITGAAGSIGLAITKAVLMAIPASLTLLDTSEAGLYQLDRNLRQAGSSQHTPILGSVCDAGLLAHTFQRYRPQIVFHAAALKHVPLMEQNPFAVIETNALGTLAVAQTAIAHGVDQLILVSTDKAVDPLSIMGASKRIAELILLAHDAATTRLTAVRLCNVLGSQGSVLPLFLEQIANGGPLTVTHPDASRYFIALDRAVDAILSALPVPGSPSLLMPDPGASTRILDLAKYLLQEHASAASIEFTGLRPGDKIAEALLSSNERRSTDPVDDTSILYAIESPAPPQAIVFATLSALREAIHARDLPRLLTCIQTLVPNYHPSKLLDTALTSELASEIRA